jgi:PAS domain S-box-containing protein
MEAQTVSKEHGPYPSTWSPDQAGAIQNSMGRPVGEALIAVDRTSHIVFANAGATELFGWKADEVVGLPLNALIHKRHHQSHAQHLADFMDSNSPGRTIERPGLNARHKNGYVFETTLVIARVGSGPDAVLITSIRPRNKR